jgi:hypothetical protein
MRQAQAQAQETSDKHQITRDFFARTRLRPLHPCSKSITSLLLQLNKRCHLLQQTAFNGILVEVTLQPR